MQTRSKLQSRTEWLDTEVKTPTFQYAFLIHHNQFKSNHCRLIHTCHRGCPMQVDSIKQDWLGIRNKANIMNIMRFAFARGCCNTIYKSGVFILEDKRWLKVKTFNPNIYHFLIKQYYNRYFLFIACFYLLMHLSILLTVSFPTCCNALESL